MYLLAVGLDQVEALGLMVPIHRYGDFLVLSTPSIQTAFVGSYLEVLGVVVPSVRASILSTRLRQQLTAVHCNRVEGQRSISGQLVGAMLPLHDAAGAFGVGGFVGQFCYRS